LGAIDLGDEFEKTLRRRRDVTPEIDDLRFEACARCAGR
jgi:hypothetical protein